MKTTAALDVSNGINLSRKLRRAAGIPKKQKPEAHTTPGRIVKRGKFKVWTGAVPATPLAEAVEQSRHYAVAKRRSRS